MEDLENKVKSGKVSRRGFLKAGALAVIGGVYGCERVADRPDSYVDLREYIVENKEQEVAYSPERLERFKQALGKDRYEALNTEQKNETEKLFSKDGDSGVQELICQAYENPKEVKKMITKKYGEDRTYKITDSRRKEVAIEIPWINEGEKPSPGDEAFNYFYSTIVQDNLAKAIAKNGLGFF